MRASRGTEQRETGPPGDNGARRRLAIEAGMLAFLVALALVFVTSAPS